MFLKKSKEKMSKNYTIVSLYGALTNANVRAGYINSTLDFMWTRTLSEALNNDFVNPIALRMAKTL